MEYTNEILFQLEVSCYKKTKMFKICLQQLDKHLEFIPKWKYQVKTPHILTWFQL